MRCQFIKWNGAQCSREAVDARDGRCAYHNHQGRGAAAKTVSQQALAMARMPACEALYDIIDNWDRARCPRCLLPDSSSAMLRTIIRAAEVVLDRTGMGPRSTVELTAQSDGDVNLELMLPDERAEFFALVARFKELKARVRLRTEALGADVAERELPPMQAKRIM